MVKSTTQGRMLLQICLLLVFQDLRPILSNAFLTSPLQQQSSRHQRHKERLLFVLRLSIHENNEEEEEEEDIEDEDCDENPIPYRNRSVAWTRRYRKLLPYEKARLRAMSLGLRSADEWDDHLQDGKVFQHGPYLPTQPDLMYYDSWISWEEFLGIMRPYKDAKHVVGLLGLKNETQYKDFVSCNTQRAEGLRIPAKPEIVYRDKGWVSYDDFLGVVDK